MKLSKFNYLTLNIIILFSVAIASTFIGDNFHSFFGDTLCQGRYYDSIKHSTYGCLENQIGEHNPTWHWGYRHWLYFTMCLILFVLNSIRIVDNLTDKNKTNENTTKQKTN